MLTADVLMSKERFEKLPPGIQDVLTDAAVRSARHERKLYADSDNSLLEDLEERGVMVTCPDPAPFREASKSVYEQFIRTEEDRKLLEAILE